MAHMEFFYDISCPFAYVGATLVARDAALASVTTFRPVLLGGVYEATQAPQG